MCRALCIGSGIVISLAQLLTIVSAGCYNGNCFFSTTSTFVSKAVAIIGNGDASGSVVFTQTFPGQFTTITGTISGLSDGMHGFHIHQLGNLTGGCTAAAGHYNPFMNNHGAPTDRVRHVGDLGNIRAVDGKASFMITDALISLNGPTSVIGRAVVVHEGQDDLGKGGDAESLKTGNAGARAGCGVIGIAEERVAAYGGYGRR